MQLIDTKITFSSLAKLEVGSHQISHSNLIQLKFPLVDHFGLEKGAFLQEEINSWFFFSAAQMWWWLGEQHHRNMPRSHNICIVDLAFSRSCWWHIIPGPLWKGMVIGNTCQIWWIATPPTKWSHLIQLHTAQMAFHYVGKCCIEYKTKNIVGNRIFILSS